MKIEKHHKINFFDIDHEFKLRIQSAARFFQEMAVLHSTKIGAGPDVLFEKGVVWLLNRLEIEFFRYPMLDEDIKLTTWSRGFKGYKGFREYHIHSSVGDIARGSGVWLFFDTKRKRISKVPAQISRLYAVEKEKWFEKEINDWQTCGIINPEKQIEISLRYSDFDVNGHVNNTIYLGFLETLYHKILNSNSKPIKNIKIRFCREIGRDKDKIRTGWYKNNGVYQCNIFDGATLYADAEIIPMD
ncbi:MAG: hypothetical protein HOG03_05415 [Desulfobacula sp.]|jgi:medium-chain acyl-[acyl-carrier-protein] hydrolase|uniref:acyl-[acyl-carrier-protein] thioesterase n=1 Tax=Desulfobacula sp. TaxID=2593537 RepID=UPI001D54D8C8|nr:hypothetical protein [Desulfobacula sp.]MBT3485844.1 hypothetical protein [Desulfobacula sp.]MBT3804022.1 hypothetical protein [Desulfobacula sp.]MBT4023637.1 hypothetical protein [Desulfobacula sp.]MBT4197695.1 hypothetical protein [Desulfobacula sp.]